MARPVSSFRVLPVVITDANDVPYVTCICRDCGVDYYIDHLEPIPGDIATVHWAQDPESHGDVVKHRCNLMRSMLDDIGLHLPEHAAIRDIYIEYGLGDPLEIVQELEVVDWFHRCTSYDPSLDKAHLQQVKHRPRINFCCRTLPEGEALVGANSGVYRVSRQKRRKTEKSEGGEDQGRKEESKLSTAMGHDLGSDWHTQVDQQAKA
ncbi:hypothetical protein BGZ96_011337, partial [Linnemannia gamsii]